MEKPVFIYWILTKEKAAESAKAAIPAAGFRWEISPPYTPWCAPFYHRIARQVNFISLSISLLESYWQFFQLSPGAFSSDLLDGLAAPGILENQGSATQNAQTTAKSTDFRMVPKESGLRFISRLASTLHVRSCPRGIPSPL